MQSIFDSSLDDTFEDFLNKYDHNRFSRKTIMSYVRASLSGEGLEFRMQYRSDAHLLTLNPEQSEQYRHLLRSFGNSSYRDLIGRYFTLLNHNKLSLANQIFLEQYNA